MRTVIIEATLDKLPRPPADWQPTIRARIDDNGVRRIYELPHWNKKRTIWRAHSPMFEIIDMNSDVVVEMEDVDGLVTIRLVRLTREPALA